MMSLSLRDLIVLTIREPARAAQILLQLKLSREALWTGLLLVAVLNTMLFSLSNLLVPSPQLLPLFMESPTIYLIMIFAGLLLTCMAVHWVGRAAGGKGSLQDVMVLIVWLQGLRVLVQCASLLLILTVPFLSMLLVLAAAAIGLYITVHFVNQAHRFNSIGLAFGVLIASGLAIVLGLSALISVLFGAQIQGSLPNV